MTAKNDAASVMVNVGGVAACHQRRRSSCGKGYERIGLPFAGYNHAVVHERRMVQQKNEKKFKIL